jgi:hypothetical protein
MFMLLPSVSRAQYGNVLREGVWNAWAEMRRCPEGWECVFIDSFLKESNEKELKQYDLTKVAAEKGFQRVVILQEISGAAGVIVNTVRVGKQGRWKEYVQAARLPAGRTEMDVPVPPGSPAMLITFDHGRGAKVEVVLERRLEDSLK